MAANARIYQRASGRGSAGQLFDVRFSRESTRYSTSVENVGKAGPPLPRTPRSGVSPQHTDLPRPVERTMPRTDRDRRYASQGAAAVRSERASRNGQMQAGKNPRRTVDISSRTGVVKLRSRLTHRQPPDGANTITERRPTTMRPRRLSTAGARCSPAFSTLSTDWVRVCLPTAPHC